MYKYRNLQYHRHCPAQHHYLVFFVVVVVGGGGGGGFIQHKTLLFSTQLWNLLHHKYCRAVHNYWILLQHKPLLSCIFIGLYRVINVTLHPKRLHRHTVYSLLL